MTDHLHRLAAHALDRLPSARPRLASRFEPMLAAAPALADPDDPVFRSADRLRVTKAMPMPQPASEVEPQLTAIRPTEFSAPISSMSPDFARESEGARQPTAAGASADRPAAEPLQKGNPSTRTANPAPVRRRRDTVGIAPEAEPARVAESIDVPDLHLETTMPTIAPRPAAVAPTADRRAASIRPPTDPRVITALLAPLQGAEQPMSPARSSKVSISTATPIRASTALEELTTQGVPMVQVTIGRIEVRAAPATDRPGPAGKTASVMGLDEYLKRRGRGEGT